MAGMAEAGVGTTVEAMDRIIREDEARRISGLGRTARWKMERAGTFPQRRAIVGRITGYLESELREWVRSRPVSSYTPPAAAMRARAARKAGWKP